MTKICSKCKEEKSLALFYKKPTGTKGVTSYCKKCDLQYKKQKYQLTKEARNISVRKRYYELKAINNSLLIEYIGGKYKCSMCGLEDDCVEVYEWHHLDPSTKDYNISNIITKRDFSIIREELDKCILVCANCHRKIHHKQKQGIKNGQS